MITVEVEPKHGIAILRPEGTMHQSDFETIKGVVDPYIDKGGQLRGIILQARRFPGWESFRYLSDRLRFDADQHEHVARVALVSDTELSAEIKDNLKAHFPRAQVRSFAYTDYIQAEAWLKEPVH